MADLEAFESNLFRILLARELRKTAALVSNLCPNTSDPQLVCIHCDTSSHCQSDSDDLQDDHKASTEWQFEEHLYFAAGCWPAGKKIYDDAVCSRVWAAVKEQYLPTVPVPVHHMEIFYNAAAEPDRALLKLPIQGYVPPTTVEKRIGAAALEWEKVQGGIQ